MEDATDETERDYWTRMDADARRLLDILDARSREKRRLTGAGEGNDQLSGTQQAPSPGARVDTIGKAVDIGDDERAVAPNTVLGEKVGPRALSRTVAVAGSTTLRRTGFFDLRAMLCPHFAVAGLSPLGRSRSAAGRAWRRPGRRTEEG